MGWLITIFVVAMIIGPIMYMRPTEKEKRLSSLRLAARKAGLNVKLARLPVLDPELSDRVTAGGEILQPERSCVAYQLQMRGDENIPVDIRLLRIPEEPSMPYKEIFPGWALDPVSATGWSAGATDGLREVIARVLDRAPPYCIAFGVDARFLSCYWLEKAGATGPEVEEIRQFLNAAEPLVAGYFS